MSTSLRLEARVDNQKINILLPSVLWHCRLDIRKSIRPVKIEWWGAGMYICLDQGLHPIISCFWCRLTQVVLEKRLLNRCLTVCLFAVGISSVHSAEMLFFFVYNYLFPVFEMAVCCFVEWRGVPTSICICWPWPDISVARPPRLVSQQIPYYCTFLSVQQGTETVQLTPLRRTLASSP